MSYLPTLQNPPIAIDPFAPPPLPAPARSMSLAERIAALGPPFKSMTLEPNPFTSNRSAGVSVAHLLLNAAVREWAHLLNIPVRDSFTERPPKGVWMPAFIRSTTVPGWDKTWLRLAAGALQRDEPTLSLGRLTVLESEGFEDLFKFALADMIAGV